jgi:hypothetical protein
MKGALMTRSLFQALSNLLLIPFLAAGCSSAYVMVPPTAIAAETNNAAFETDTCLASKIAFDLKVFDKNGLIGPYAERVSVDYEFCIPYTPKHVNDIQAIDPQIECYHGPRGRIGCGDAEYLCLGNTGSENYKNILCQLSLLNYIKSIERAWWE